MMQRNFRLNDWKSQKIGEATIGGLSGIGCAETEDSRTACGEAVLSAPVSGRIPC
jgi:hypothetical protein